MKSCENCKHGAELTKHCELCYRMSSFFKDCWEAKQ